MNLTPWRRKPEEQRFSMDDWIQQWFLYQQHAYPLSYQQSLRGDKEEIPSNLAGYVQGAYQSDGVVFACMLVRMLLFSEARFQFRQMRQGRPGDLFGTAELGILEQPSPGHTTGDLLTRAIQDADLAGNFFCVRRGRSLYRLRPDWVDIVLGSNDDIEMEVTGYLYHAGGRNLGTEPIALTVDEVCHFAPIPDPGACYRGMSWLTPVIREIQADKAATAHKLKFFENGATSNLAVKFDPNVSREAFEAYVQAFKDQHQGLANAYKTLFLGGGADVSVIGANFEQMDFKVVQGAGETRIAAAAGVPPVIVGLSEGLAAATYSNYQLAMRRFADLTMRPLWRNMAGSLSSVVNVPGGAELWYDDRDIPALAENEKDRGEIQQSKAATIKQLIDAGFEPDTVVQAVEADDLSRLSHTGLFSVQLQPPGTEEPTPSEMNGSGNPEDVPVPTGT